MRSEFIAAIKTHDTAFGLGLSKADIERLADYYDLIQKHNEILHLVAPCSAEEFAIRHILESLTLLEYLSKNARFADVGAGAGLPSIPCLLVRDDLKAILIESKIKKAKFLEKAVEELRISNRPKVINRQFEEVESSNFSYVACRALDKFTEKLPRLLKWSKKRRLLLFGGNNLREALTTQKVKFDEKIMPLSEQRYLFIVNYLP
jgi:16S rRNA (guanine527-N7)-methyltransferase